MTLVAILLTCLGLLIVAGFAVQLKTQSEQRREAEMTATLLLGDVAELKAAVAELKAANGALHSAVAGMKVELAAHLKKLDEIKIDIEGPVSIMRPPDPS